MAPLAGTSLTCHKDPLQRLLARARPVLCPAARRYTPLTSLTNRKNCEFVNVIIIFLVVTLSLASTGMSMG